MAKSSVMIWMIMMTSVQVIQSLDESVTAQQNQPMEAQLIDAFSRLFDNVLPGYKYCPPPYSHILGECFYIHKFIPQLTWKDAHTFCKQAGGILAEPKNFGAVLAHLFNTGIANNIFDGIFNRVWLGGHRVGNTTTFEWLSSGQPIKDSVEVGSASYFNEGGGDCIMMVVQREGPPTLMANACNTKTHYACQLP